MLNGAKELQAKLAKLADKEAKAALRKGTRAGAKIVQAKAKDLAPVKTGQLKRGLKVRALPRNKKYVGTMVQLADTGEVFYGAFVDLGTKYIKARHFLKNAADEVKDDACNKAVVVAQQEILRSMTK